MTPIEIVCQLNVPVTAKQAKVLEKALAAAVKKAYPDHRLRACWVHEQYTLAQDDKL